jgi:hypothetical protein
VGGSGWNDYRLTRVGNDRLPAKPKSHPALDHGEALFLDRVDMACRDMAAWRKEMIEDQHLAAGLRPALPNDDPLTADRVDQCSWR